MGILDLLGGKTSPIASNPGLASRGGGILDALLGADNPFAQFADSRQNTLGAIGAGLASGPTFAQGLANAAQGVPQARQLDQQTNIAINQQNATFQYLKAKHPELAQAVLGGMPIQTAWQQALQLDNPTGVALQPGATLVNPKTGAQIGGSPSGPSDAADPTHPPVGANMGQPFPGTVNGQQVMLIATQFGGPRVYGATSGGVGGQSMGSIPAQTGFDQFGNAPQAAPRGVTIQSPAQVAAETAGLTDRAKAIAAKPEQRIAAQTSLAQLAQSDNLVSGFIDTAMKQADDLGSTGWLGKLSEQVPGSPAYKLAKTLDTVKANIGFDKLAAMRAASPSGGALGQVSNFEEQLLQSVLGSLDQGQDASTVKANLQRLKDYMAVNDKQRLAAFNADFANVGTPSGAPLPTPNIGQSIPTEQTATNPATGQKIVLRGGQWVPY